MASDDTEITLSTGKLLGLFFLLVALCGVFLSIGYSLGKSAADEQALNDQPTQVLAAPPPGTTASGISEDKASATVAVKSDTEQPAPHQATTSNPQSTFTFYKAVQQNGGQAEPPAKDPAPAALNTSVASETAAATTPHNATQPNETAGRGTPEITRSGPVTGPGTMVVQIAAISREDDAVALAGALRKKEYNVFVVNNPTNNDKLYHVQVGPFSTMREAEAMKAKLIAEGYNPIVKK
jgi:DedD protein